MTAPMTTERLEQFREWYAEERAELEAQPRYEPTIDWKEDAVRELLDEVDRLRVEIARPSATSATHLPVLQTCGECGHRARSHSEWVCREPSRALLAARTEKASRVEPSLAPPSWCPLRPRPVLPSGG